MIFKNLKGVQEHLEREFQKFLEESLAVEMILSEAMTIAVENVVYDAYEPEQYERRKVGGLSDPKNMEIEDVTVKDNMVHLTMINTTKGVDSMVGKYITDTIVDGIKENWSNSNGAWSEPRDFITAATKELKDNPQALLAAIKKGMAAGKYKFL